MGNRETITQMAQDQSGLRKSSGNSNEALNAFQIIMGFSI